MPFVDPAYFQFSPSTMDQLGLEGCKEHSSNICVDDLDIDAAVYNTLSSKFPEVFFLFPVLFACSMKFKVYMWSIGY